MASSDRVVIGEWGGLILGSSGRAVVYWSIIKSAFASNGAWCRVQHTRISKGKGTQMKGYGFQLTLGYLLISILFSLTDSRASAQDNGAAGLEIVNLTGRLEAIVGNQLKLVGDDKTASVVLIGDDSTFNYSGTADPAVLAPGLLVRFVADFDYAGKPQAPLTELEIFRPMHGRRLPLEVQQRQTPGIYPIDPQGPASEAPKRNAKKTSPANNVRPEDKARSGSEEKKSADLADKPAANQATQPTSPDAVQAFQVVGMVRAVQGDHLQILAGNRPLILQTSSDLKITVASGDATFCQPGDEVKLSALKLPNGIIQADTIIVTGAKPLGVVDPRALARGNRNKPDFRAANPKVQPGKEPATKERRPNR